MQLAELERSRVDHRTKGIPGGSNATALKEIGQRGWNVLKEDLVLPLAVLRDSALTHNGQWMRRFLEASGALFAPHGKTTMAPQLFKRQLDDGAWGITVATAQQLAVCRDFGVKRVVMANQLIGRHAIRYVLDEIARDPQFDFYCLVDSLDGVRILAAAAKARGAGRPLQVLLEGGIEGGRTGVRDLATGLAVARAVAASRPHLELRGTEGFEGLLQGKTPEERQAKVDAFLDFLAELAVKAGQEGLFGPGDILLSAGGSAFYDRVVERFRQAKVEGAPRIVIRSGCYLTHDDVMYSQAFKHVLERSPVARGLGEGLQPALEVWTYVQSRPEFGRALVTMGRRDAGADAGWPLPIKWFRPGVHDRPQAIGPGHVCVGMNDQHGYLDLPVGSPLKVGDLVAFGVSHPCTTFDSWQVLYVVDDDYNVTDAIRTFF